MNASVAQLESAMEEFDRNMRGTKEWSAWTENSSYKFAIFKNGKIYPVKQIVSMATGLPKSAFSGGSQANTLVSKYGLRLLSLKESSWTIQSENDAVKILDKSAFSQGTGIPFEIRPFFFDEAPPPGVHYPVDLILNGKKFESYLAVESSPSHRSRLFWHQDFIKELSARFPVHYERASANKDFSGLLVPLMRLTRINSFKAYVVTLQETENTDTDWTDSELEAAVMAYLKMREQEMAGLPYSKAEVNRSLRDGELSRRSKASIEYRMQNISAVLSEMCAPTIKGYLPAKNVGSQTKIKLLSTLDRLGVCSQEDYEPNFDQQVVDARVKRLLTKPFAGIPKGQTTPSQTTKTTVSYARDPLVKAWVLQKSEGRCEGCCSPAPFLNKDEAPYLEVHHLIKLAEGGPDTVENAVALCPNCHRRCHFGNDGESFTLRLFEGVERLKR
ncbi:HNH endonuclease [Geomonas oryzae]|uniref:HNH endonuclease n=1 Tax=Geomonas oryzae TaxID=2364273 RepID=UPI00100B7AD0|nr:HNH endonuclease signature motif containing protein [Geomonas oryzae]